MWRAVLVLTAGCGRFGFSAVVDDRTDAGADGPPLIVDGPIVDSPAMPGCATSERTVHATAFDALPAFLTPYGGAPQLVVADGVLAITPDPNSGMNIAYWGVIEGARSDHRGKRLLVEVPQMLNTARAAQVLFRISADDVWAQFYQHRGALVTETRIAETYTGSDRPYDPIAHRWWQLRERAGTVFFEVSPDGVSWTQLEALPTPPVYANGHIEIAAGYFEPQTMPLGTVHFDNLLECE